MAFYRWYLSNAVVSEEQHEKIWKFVENFDNLENIIAFQGNWKNFPKFNSIYNFDDNNDDGDGGDDDDDGDCDCWQPALDISSFSLTRLIGRASLDHDWMVMIIILEL